MSNLLVFPSDPTNAAWIKTSTGSAVAGVAPDPGGGTNAFSITDSDAAAVTAWHQEIAIASSTLPYCLSVKIKKNAGSGKGISIDIRTGAFGAPSKLRGVIVSDSLGTITPRTGFVPDVGYAISSYDANWWIAYMTMANDSNLAMFAVISPAFNDNSSGVVDVASQGTAVLWDVVLEQTTTPTVVPPVANFTRTPSAGSLPLSVAFTDTSTYAPSSWLWDFGDGSTSTSQNPTHVYAIPGQYTVKLTSTNAGGSNTKTMVSAVLAGAITTQRPDARLVGATYLAVTPSLLAISCIDTRQVVIANRSNASIAGTTGDLGTWPGAIMYFQSALWYVTAAGNVVSMTNAANPVTLTTTATGAAVTGWITGTGSIVVAPGAAGGIVTLNTSGTILARIEGLLSRVQFAAASGSYVFAFDGLGNGAVVLVASSGGMTLVARFAAPNCQAIVSGYVSGNSLILACSGRSDVVTIDISAPSAPVVGAPVSYAPDTINAVLNDAAVTPLTNEEQSTLGLAYWFPVNAGSYQTGPATYLVHARSGRLSLVSD